MDAYLGLTNVAMVIVCSFWLGSSLHSFMPLSPHSVVDSCYHVVYEQKES